MVVAPAASALASAIDVSGVSKPWPWASGGARGLSDKDLARSYRSQVDPRLNYEQALELAMRVAGRRKPLGG